MHQHNNSNNQQLHKIHQLETLMPTLLELKLVQIQIHQQREMPTLRQVTEMLQPIIMMPTQRKRMVTEMPMEVMELAVLPLHELYNIILSNA